MGARPDQTQPALGAAIIKYRLLESAIPKRLYASTRTELIKADAAAPLHAIGANKGIGACKSEPDTNEIVRSLVSPYMLVNLRQSEFTSVFTASAISLTVAYKGAAPVHVTETISITR